MQFYVLQNLHDAIFRCSYMQQTNTADMLEEAVTYVKVLQKQIQVINLLTY